VQVVGGTEIAEDASSQKYGFEGEQVPKTGAGGEKEEPFEGKKGYKGRNRGG